MSSNTFTTESKSICIDRLPDVQGLGAGGICNKRTSVEFLTTYSTSSDGTAKSTIEIFSTDGDNKGEKIGYLDENGKVEIPKDGNAKLNENETQSSYRQGLINAIEKLRKQGNILKIEDITNNDQLTNAQKISILNNLGKENEANTIDSLQTEAEKAEALANAQGQITKDNIDAGFQSLSTVEVGGRKARETYGNYYYPADLSSNKQDRIKFTMGYSEGTKIDATVVTGEKSFQKRIRSISGSVTLPIVTGVSDQSSVDWKGAELNPLQAFAAAGALDLFNSAKENKSLKQIGAKGADIITGAKQGLVDAGLGDAINVWLAQKAVGAQNLLSRTTGAIVNPNLEMLFNAPQLRNFGFTFLLSPRDADEADQVRKIIRFFKQGMSVKTTASNVFLKAPNIFHIKYMTFNTDGTEILHPSINIIKTCALLSMDVQYTPAGTYMTYEDPYRTMTAYQLTMQFGELDPIYDNDYTELDNDNDTVLGY